MKSARTLTDYKTSRAWILSLYSNLELAPEWSQFEEGLRGPGGAAVMVRAHAASYWKAPLGVLELLCPARALLLHVDGPGTAHRPHKVTVIVRRTRSVLTGSSVRRLVQVNCEGF